MADLDDDGNFVDWTGNWTFATGTFTLSNGATVSAEIDSSSTISANLFVPDGADGADIGSTSLEFSDIYVADGSIIKFGNDQDVTITHDADDGLTFAVAGATNNEDLNIDFETTANTITLSSSIGITTLALTGTMTTITTVAADNPYMVLDDDDDMDVYFINDDVGAELEISTDSTVGQNNMAKLSEAGALTTTSNMTIGVGADVDHTLTFDADDTDGVIQRMADEKTFKLNNLLAVTSQTYDATDAADTDVTVGTELTSSIVIITGDNDSDGDEIDLQNGNVDGQILMFIAGTGIDADDIITIDVATDTTCTGCGTVALDTAGDSYMLTWASSSWYLIGDHPAE